MTLTLRRPEPGEATQFVRTFADVMNQGLDEEQIATEAERLELDRSWVAVEGRAIVGTITGHSFELTLPGGSTLPMAGLTLASVVPTHRRRGILSQLMARFDHDVADREESLIGLFASEAAIYGRYGFGPATRFSSVTVERGRTGLNVDLPGTIRWSRAIDAADEIADIFDRTRTKRPGEIRRPRHMLDALLRRSTKGDKHPFVAIHDGPDGADGYAIHRIESRWIDHTAQNEVKVIELTGDGLVRAGLWKFLLELDLVRTVTDGNARLDEPIQDLLGDPRQLRVSGIYDQLQLRVVDPIAALKARTYGNDGGLRLAVDGSTYEMNVDGGKADVTRTDQNPDLTLTPAALAMAYLGDRPLRSMKQSGLARFEEPTGEAADGMFSVSPAPQCLTLF